MTAKEIEACIEGLREELLTCPNAMCKHDIRQEILGWEAELEKVKTND